ncbi:TPA: hypothetical protein M4197_004093 [Klebsiella variicola]|nr:hypothetical protein [Klebsiella variicola]
MNDYIARYCMINGISCGLSAQPAGTGFLTVNNSVIQYCANAGVGVTGRNELIICNNVRAWRISNDGFGQHAPVGGAGKMILNGCDSSYNGDQAGQSAQGASNHESTKMVINGGAFNFNVSGGMVAIENAQCDIHGDTKYGPVVMDGNMRLGNTAGTISSQAGCTWLNYATGIVTGDVTVKNGNGVGVRRGPEPLWKVSQRSTQSTTRCRISCEVKMTVCRLCQCEPMVMTKPETDGAISFYVYYVECSGCGVGTKRFSEQSFNAEEAIQNAQAQWALMNAEKEVVSN